MGVGSSLSTDDGCFLSQFPTQFIKRVASDGNRKSPTATICLGLFRKVPPSSNAIAIYICVTGVNGEICQGQESHKHRRLSKDKLMRLIDDNKHNCVAQHHVLAM